MHTSSAPGADRPPRLSVIVPVYNEIATARQALDAIVAKEIPGWDLEIIMIESNSRDGSREVVLGYRGHPRVKIILEDAPKGKGAAVRKGLDQATGDVAYFISKDDLIASKLAAGRPRDLLDVEDIREAGK